MSAYFFGVRAKIDSLRVVYRPESRLSLSLSRVCVCVWKYKIVDVCGIRAMHVMRWQVARVKRI